MVVYLSGPMANKPDLNFPAFHRAAAQLRSAGHEVFNPAETDFGKPPAEVTHREALAVDLAWLCQFAQGIALLEGWEQSRGAQAEVAAAKAIGAFVGTVEDYL